MEQSNVSKPLQHSNRVLGGSGVSNPDTNFIFFIKKFQHK
jgi:hypothetical protein